MEVVIVPSAGNLTWEIKVSGKDLLWLSYESIEDRNTHRNVTGMIFGAPRLREGLTLSPCGLPPPAGLR